MEIADGNVLYWTVLENQRATTRGDFSSGSHLVLCIFNLILSFHVLPTP